jgi:hypothetical protein
VTGPADYNPYAAPQAPPPDAGAGASGSPQPWEIGEVFGLAWTRFKQNWVPAVVSVFVATLISFLINATDDILVAAGVLEKDSTEQLIVMSVALTVGFLVTVFFEIGIVRMQIAFARGETSA